MEDGTGTTPAVVLLPVHPEVGHNLIRDRAIIQDRSTAAASTSEAVRACIFSYANINHSRARHRPAILQLDVYATARSRSNTFRFNPSIRIKHQRSTANFDQPSSHVGIETALIT